MIGLGVLAGAKLKSEDLSVADQYLKGSQAPGSTSPKPAEAGCLR